MTDLVLGHAFGHWETKELYVGHIVGQKDYGRGRRFTDYPALRKGLSHLSEVARVNELPLYIPYMIGCGLAGGTWEFVSMIIEELGPNAIVCKL